MCVCLRLAPAEAPSTELGGGECAVHQCVHQGVRAPLYTTAAINRLQSSLALSACKSGAVVVVGVGWGLVLVHPHSHLHQDQALV